jgi:hypothetical protein
MIKSCEFVLAAVYRPGSKSATTQFVSDLADIIERLVIYAAPLVIVGDFNVHLDDIQSAITVGVNKVLSDFDLLQLVTGPTHSHGHTLDVFIVSNEITATVNINPPIFSDHSLITAQLDMTAESTKLNLSSTITRRCWTNFDIEHFREDLRSSEFVLSPPNDISLLLAGYDLTLRMLLDKHAPSRVSQRRRQDVKWYNADCRQAQRSTRRFEKIYRSTKSPSDFLMWREQFKNQRRVFQRARSSFWVSVLDDSPDPRSLWRQLNSLLKTAKSLSIPQSPSAMASFFENKVKSIRMTTAAAPQSNIVFREVPSFSSFGQFSADDVLSFIRKAPDKQCILDPLPKAILKQCSDILAPAFNKLG